MNRLIITLIVLAVGLNASSIKTYENGNTYKIEEENIVNLFRNHVSKNKEKIQARFYEERKKMIDKIENYKPTTLSLTVPDAKKDMIFYPKIEHTTTEDVKDSHGNILYKKGFKFNPLHYISMNERYLFLNYNDKKQVKWLKDNNFQKDITTKIIITDGKVFDAIKDLKREVFYANDILLNKFEIQGVPSLVEQEQDKIKVSQYKIKDKK